MKKIFGISKLSKRYVKENQFDLLMNLFKDSIYEVTYNQEEIGANYIDVIKCFVENGMSVNILDENNSLLVIAEVLGNCFELRYYEYLLGKSISLNIINKDGDTILDIIERLCIDCYNKIDEKGYDFELSNQNKYYFYRDLILLMKAYNAKCSFEIQNEKK